MKRMNRFAIAVVLIVSLLASGVTRQLAENRRKPASGVTNRRNSLASMNSFALALMLGGLRGPLVMVLWTQSEQQKQQKDLEGFDTRIEWIRLLQPEFDTVHIFQIWNKAYNVSVQMASLSNKYTTILDALDYARKVDAERPNDINITASTAGIWFDKLGNSYEKQYYRQRVRQETLPHPSRQKRDRKDVSWRRLELDPVLDDQGNILPAYQSELEYLKPYQPFKYGVSPYAFAFNYYKQAQILQSAKGQRHAQLSDSVVDSRPALSLKQWFDEEWEQGRRKELEALGFAVPAEKLDFENPSAFIAWSEEAKPAETEAAIFSYDLALRLATDAKSEYEQHLKRFRINYDMYRSHMDHVDASVFYLAADRDYLKIRTAPQQDRAALIRSCRQNYQLAWRRWAAILLKYYMEDEAAHELLINGLTRDNLIGQSNETLAGLVQQSAEIVRQFRGPNYHNEDRDEYKMYMTRCEKRLAKLAQ